MSTVFISTFDDPTVNLSLETCLMNLWQPQYRWLFLWQNRPCIVIGRFQNPWLECRMDILRKNNIPLVRRYSGGGCVYHDQGNLCFTFFNATWNRSKEENLDFVIASLKSLGIRLYRNHRHDLLHSTPDGLSYKISGSAFKQKKDRALHHGTLLIESDLNALKNLLSPPAQSITSKALPSTPSPVANLAHFNKKITVSRVRHELARSFSPHIRYLKKDFIRQNHSLYQKEYQKISHWQWRHGETPTFTQTVTKNFSNKKITFTLEVCKGVMAKIHPIEPSLLPDNDFRQLERSLLGRAYCPTHFDHTR